FTTFYLAMKLIINLINATIYKIKFICQRKKMLLTLYRSFDNFALLRL
ncbi:MAG: hypothetical protein BROFUL_00363, partial [Candidatus Brocadia fulgida]